MKILKYLGFTKETKYIGIPIFGSVLVVIVNLFVKSDMYSAGINGLLLGYILNLYLSYRKFREDKEDTLDDKIRSNKYKKLESLPTLVNNLSISSIKIKIMLTRINIKYNYNKSKDLKQIRQYLLNDFDKIIDFLYWYQKLDDILQISYLNKNEKYYNLTIDIYHDYENIYNNIVKIIEINNINKLENHNLINDNIYIIDSLIYKIQHKLRQQNIDIVKEEYKKIIDNKKDKILNP